MWHMKQTLTVIAFLMLVVACTEEQSSTTTITSNPTSKVPERLVNLGFDLSINDEELKQTFSGFPEFEDKLRLNFSSETVFIRSDLYDDWQYDFEFEVTQLENTATIKLNDGQNESFFELVFVTETSGEWSLSQQSQTGTSVQSGQFFYSIINPPVAHAFDGKVEAKNTIYSSVTGVTYPYRVYLPSGYVDNVDKSYPIIYVTDGQWVFWDFCQYLDIQSIPAIMVAIEQGPNNRRETDYLLPGSHEYIQFFKTEFMPFIERTYRVDSDSRTIQGASYGGLVVSHFLYDHFTQPSFSHFISADGSYWQNTTAYQTLELSVDLKIDPESPINLYLSSATIEGNHVSVEQYKSRLDNLAFENLNIHFVSHHVTHVEAALPSFTDAIGKIFSPK